MSWRSLLVVQTSNNATMYLLLSWVGLPFLIPKMYADLKVLINTVSKALFKSSTYNWAWFMSGGRVLDIYSYRDIYRFWLHALSLANIDIP